MPLYEYRCEECGLPFEKMVRFSEVDVQPVCPNCGCKDTRKQISTVAAFGSSDSGTGYSSSNSCGSSGGFT
jgi:putative FmdB family regulatory protein